MRGASARGECEVGYRNNMIQFTGNEISNFRDQAPHDSAAFRLGLLPARNLHDYGYSRRSHSRVARKAYPRRKRRGTVPRRKRRGTVPHRKRRGTVPRQFSGAFKHWRCGGAFRRWRCGGAFLRQFSGGAFLRRKSSTHQFWLGRS